MRFIKKAGFNNLLELSNKYNEFELYTTRLDFNKKNIAKNLKIIKTIYKKGAIITSIHVPYSKYKTSIDAENELSTNYMSWCEIIKDEEEKQFFLLICKFVQKIASIYNENNSKSLLHIEKKEGNKNKVIVIVHTGCVLGCDERISAINCINYINQDPCYENLDNNYNFLEQLLQMNNIIIAFENITPYYDDNKLGNNRGYKYENFVLAEKLNEFYDTSIFGTVVDFCHIFATHALLERKDKDIDYFMKYMDSIGTERRKLIKLFHLSKYDKKNNLHGEVFDGKKHDKEILDSIRNWYLKNLNMVPITLEVKDSEDIQRGNKNFDKIILEWIK